jgi:hypothetical protein
LDEMEANSNMKEAVTEEIPTKYRGLAGAGKSFTNKETGEVEYMGSSGAKTTLASIGLIAAGIGVIVGLGAVAVSTFTAAKREAEAA